MRTEKGLEAAKGGRRADGPRIDTVALVVARHITAIAVWQLSPRDTNIFVREHTIHN